MNNDYSILKKAIEEADVDFDLKALMLYTLEMVCNNSDVACGMYEVLLSLYEDEVDGCIKEVITNPEEDDDEFLEFLHHQKNLISILDGLSHKYTKSNAPN